MFKLANARKKSGINLVLGIVDRGTEPSVVIHDRKIGQRTCKTHRIHKSRVYSQNAAKRNPIAPTFRQTTHILVLNSMHISWLCNNDSVASGARREFEVWCEGRRKFVFHRSGEN